ncbi:MAG: outer membrane protein transport protein [Candidatus Eisenbacteria bacterium]|nr:outer membrane protein transport protein [Candidatus Eisenbacteria bacterium]
MLTKALRAAAPPLLVLATLLGAATAHAAAFALFEQGAAAIGRGGAFAAGVDDPSALFYNPAALAGLDGTQLLLSPSLILFDDSFSGVDPYPGYGVEESTAQKAFPLPSFYLSRGITRGVTAAVGLTVPFGLQTDWTNSRTFSGRFVAWNSRIEQIDASAGLAAEVAPRFRLGASLNMTWSKILLERAVAAPLPGTDVAPEVGKVGLESGRETALGGTFGAQWVPSDRVSLGGTLRTGTSNEFVTPARFTYYPFTTGNHAADSTIAATLPHDQDATVKVRFPLMLLAGLQVKLTPELAAELDVNWTRWSAFDTITLALSRNPERSVVAPQAFHNAAAVRLGLEYRLDEYILRAGAYYDATPQPEWAMSPLISDTDRIGLTAGAGFRADSGLSADIYALLVMFRNRSTEFGNLNHFDGTYKPRAFIFGASLGKKW